MVDDHDPSLKWFHAFGELAGHCCASVHSATKALGYCDCRRPQVVVTDMSMPNLDGMGQICWLWCSCPNAPLILMTTLALDGSDLLGLRRTFNEVSFKPVDVARFLIMLNRMMPQNGFSPHT